MSLRLQGLRLPLPSHLGGARGMAVNWFEGGRRMRDLLLWAVVLGGGVYVLWGDTPAVYFETDSPEDDWKFTGKDCPYPNDSKYLWSHAFKPGDKRSVKLCFRATEDEKIPYRAITGPPLGGGSAPPLKVFAIGEPYDAAVKDYMQSRTAEFRMTRELERAAQDGLFKLALNAGWQRFQDAFGWVSGFVVVLWILAAVFGWIIRGFAGIPSGADFRPTKRV